MTNLGGTGVSENTDFDDEITELLARQDRLNPATMAIAIANATLKVDDILHVVEYFSGTGGAGIWKVVLASTVTINPFNIRASTGNVFLALVLQDLEKSTPRQWGAKGNKTTDDTLPMQAFFDFFKNINFLQPNTTPTCQLDPGAVYLLTEKVIAENFGIIGNGAVFFTAGSGGILQTVGQNNVYKDFFLRYDSSQNIPTREALELGFGQVLGTHTGAANASVLSDSSKVWKVNEFVGREILNNTDGSVGLSITSNTVNTITVTLTGGTDNDWDVSDSYTISAIQQNAKNVWENIAIRNPYKGVVTHGGSGSSAGIAANTLTAIRVDFNWDWGFDFDCALGTTTLSMRSCQQFGKLSEGSTQIKGMRINNCSDVSLTGGTAMDQVADGLALQITGAKTVTIEQITLESCELTSDLSRMIDINGGDVQIGLIHSKVGLYDMGVGNKGYILQLGSTTKTANVGTIVTTNDEPGATGRLFKIRSANQVRIQTNHIPLSEIDSLGIQELFMPFGRFKGMAISDPGASFTQGTYEVSDEVINRAPGAGENGSWFCISAGTFSTATDSDGDTDGSTETITGMDDTSDFSVGEFVTVSAGFPSLSTPRKILIKTSDSVTLDVTSNSVQSNITVATVGPVFEPANPIRSANAYTPTNVSTDRAFDADTVVITELADVLGTLIADLQSSGVLK